ncbi:hypothetical protein PTKIN_Ptkin01aG0392200 [Pterospermum kingtungense]
MPETRQEDARIYVVATFFFVCIVTGGAFLCLYMFQPESESASWYPLTGIILVAIPWIFWIITYIYRCCAYCCCQRNGRNDNRVQSSFSKTHSSASTGPVATRSMHNSSDNGDSPLKSPKNDDQRHVRFGDVVVLGGNKDNQSEDIEGSPGTEHEGNNDYISAASGKGEEPLIVSVST